MEFPSVLDRETIQKAIDNLKDKRNQIDERILALEIMLKWQEEEPNNKSSTAPPFPGLLRRRPLSRPWDPIEARRLWGEAIQSLRPARQVLFREVEVDTEAERQVRLRFRAENVPAQILDLVRDTLPLLETFFREHAPWRVRVAIESPKPSGPSEEKLFENLSQRETCLRIINSSNDVLTVRQVAERAQGGGYKFRAERPEPSVSTTLRRLAQEGLIRLISTNKGNFYKRIENAPQGT
ncbi:MAG: hypothetical protein HYZ11_09555 [Candidatus Tectomicrobia bacterium]|uniref:Uncharacterized protein n=1 Tax=Tectimicrobiota bacterium TaxID=2528274 RepID=A0A932HYX5_UNCTE|nr:hypothetical protein [Candidatus Tectomicrobia bacterium]